MSGVNLPPDQQFYARFMQLEQNVRALATQQNQWITNAQDQPVLTIGLVPGSNPAAYGLQLLDPVTGNQMAFIGETSTGTAAAQFFDAAGHLRIQIDASGFHQYDTSGNQTLLLGTQTNGANGLGVYSGATLEAILGLINASPAIYGAGVLPFGGTHIQQVGGMLASGSLSAVGVATAGALVTFTGSPTVTAEIGPSGSVLIGGSFEIDTNNNGTKAGVQVSIDSGASFVEIAAFQVNAGTGTYVGGSTFPWSGLTAGSHTFTAQYFTSVGGNANLFGNMYIQPL